MKKLLFLLVISFLYLTLYTASANAQTMTNGSYIIQMGNFNMSAGRPTGSGYALLNTLGQTGPGLYSGTNYKVRAGFEYVLSTIPFRFKIDSTFIDFGTIAPTFPVLRANVLTVSNGSAYGYQVTVSQNHNLRVNASGAEIPATTCDAGTCTPTTAATWTSSLTYGFGYRCNNILSTDCDSQFLTANFYKPFIASPSAIVVMTSPNVGRNKVSQIVYKLNVAGSQPAGLYKNVINYIATPTF
jgi:hypothetical protein